MARIYKILPDIDDDFHPALGFVMFIMAIIMITSLFNYRSLIQALAMIYTSYVGLTFKRNIQNYIKNYNPVMAPYSKRPIIEISDDEGYEEDSDEEKDELDVKSDSPPKNLEELDETNDNWNNNLRKRTLISFNKDTI